MTVTKASLGIGDLHFSNSLLISLLNPKNKENTPSPNDALRSKGKCS